MKTICLKLYQMYFYFFNRLLKTAQAALWVLSLFLLVDLKINTNLSYVNRNADKFKPILISVCITIFLDSLGNKTIAIAICRLWKAVMHWNILSFSIIDRTHFFERFTKLLCVCVPLTRKSHHLSEQLIFNGYQIYLTGNCFVLLPF